MPRLSADLISTADNFLNPVGDRELLLRGLRIPAIEHLGATRDQYDLLNLADNELTSLGNFPLLQRLKTLFLANNRIAHIDADLARVLPNLREINLTNNSLAELGDIDALAACSSLSHIALTGNPLVRNEHYRLYVIFRVPSVRVLDFAKVKDSERIAAKSLFTTASGAANKLAQKYAGTRSEPSNAPSDGVREPTRPGAPLSSLSPAEAAEIKVLSYACILNIS
ncbi:leucine-rich repeat-domain-containing protein [Blastocladiella britannica]|nr:leucine-rich repeat-domain-containing protein [Blastocladiella britannica]